MGYQLYPEKQIHLVGLEQTGDGVYTCKYPDLLAEWLRQQGLVEVEAYGHTGHIELTLEEEDTPTQPPESGLTSAEWQQKTKHRGFVHIYKTGTVRAGGNSDRLDKMLQELLRK